MIQRRIEFTYPDSGKTLKLEEHLEQLKVLYSKIEKNKIIYKGSGIFSFIKSLGESFSQIKGISESTPNPFYPDECYEEYLSKMIIEKKKKIERVLDLR